jgi:hypothetical protein
VWFWDIDVTMDSVHKGPLAKNLNVLCGRLEIKLGMPTKSWVGVNMMETFLAMKHSTLLEEVL